MTATGRNDWHQSCKPAAQSVGMVGLLRLSGLPPTGDRDSNRMTVRLQVRHIGQEG